MLRRFNSRNSGGNDMEENCSTRKEFVRKTKERPDGKHIIFPAKHTRPRLYLSRPAAAVLSRLFMS